MYDWIDHVWLSDITDERVKAELLAKFKRGEVLEMISGLSLVIREEKLKAKEEGREEIRSGLSLVIEEEKLKAKEEAREEVLKETEERSEKKVYEEKMKRAKNLLKYLDVEIIAQEFEMTFEEVEALKGND
jgi:hypothetical protein